MFERTTCPIHEKSPFFLRIPPTNEPTLPKWIPREIASLFNLFFFPYIYTRIYISLTRLRPRIGYVVHVRQLGLEPLQAAVEAVVEHDGDGHAAQDHHHQDASQGALEIDKKTIKKWQK